MIRSLLIVAVASVKVSAFADDITWQRIERNGQTMAHDAFLTMSRRFPPFPPALSSIAPS
jgi:hypothetical protein